MLHRRSVQSATTTTVSWFARLAILGVAGIIVSQTGCNIIRSFDDTAALTYRDLVWSKRAYNLRFGNCDRPYADHFRNGFTAGYADVCGGGDGYTPALPPESYRSYEFQSADGAKCVESWFEGYPAGVAAARKDNSGSYNNIAVSRMLEAAIKQANTKPDISGKVPVVSDSKGSGTRPTNTPSVRFEPPKLSIRQPLVPEVGGNLPSVLSNDDAEPARSTAPPVVPTGFTVDPEAFDTPIPIGEATRWSDQWSQQ